jgi:membrane protease subunit (stomatin/prohibitin family)
LRGFGEYSLRVVDPTALITNLTGTVDLADPAAVEHWVAEQVFKAARTIVTAHVVTDQWPVLGLAARTPGIEAEVLPAANAALASYGLQVTRLGNLTINVSDADADQLRDLARATAYTSLAGSFGAYAQGEALLGAGTGMAHSQGAGAEALAVAALGVGGGIVGGLGIANGRGPVAPAAPASETPASEAPSSAAQSAAVAAPAVVYCSHCGQLLSDGARFCAACGTAVTSAP